MRGCVRRSKVELRCPRNSLGIGDRGSRRKHSAPWLFTQIPDLLAKTGIEGGKARAPIRNPPIR
eukprot:3986726-Alexandrium_andersonii.AAC.1